MSSVPVEYLHDIHREADYLVTTSRPLTYAEFIADETLKRAFVRSLEIIGEATKRIPEEFRRQYPNIEWRAMAGMCDVLIHNYGDVDYEVVWDAIVKKIPVLLSELESILSGQPRDNEE